MSGGPPYVLTPRDRVVAVADALLSLDGLDRTERNVAAAMADAARFVVACTALATLEREVAEANAAAMPPMTPKRRRAARKPVEH